MWRSDKSILLRRAGAALLPQSLALLRLTRDRLKRSENTVTTGLERNRGFPCAGKQRCVGGWRRGYHRQLAVTQQAGSHGRRVRQTFLNARYRFPRRKLSLRPGDSLWLPQKGPPVPRASPLRTRRGQEAGVRN